MPKKMVTVYVDESINIIKEYANAISLSLGDYLLEAAKEKIKRMNEPDVWCYLWYDVTVEKIRAVFMGDKCYAKHDPLHFVLEDGRPMRWKTKEEARDYLNREFKKEIICPLDLVPNFTELRK
jgi:hypothetical protein